MLATIYTLRGTTCNGESIIARGDLEHIKKHLFKAWKNRTSCVVRDDVDGYLVAEVWFDKEKEFGSRKSWLWFSVPELSIEAST